MSPEVLHRKLQHLATYLKDLNEFKGCSRKTYEAQHYKIDRLLELIVIVSVDITFHLLSKNGEPSPSTYSQGFLRAGEVGLLPTNLAKRLSQAAGLRNVLAHGYEDVDPEKVFKSIDAALRDFRSFARTIDKR